VEVEVVVVFFIWCLRRVAAQFRSALSRSWRSQLRNSTGRFIGLAGQDAADQNRSTSMAADCAAGQARECWTAENAALCGQEIRVMLCTAEPFCVATISRVWAL
jgi:hypothetical protein